jgi:hypothetical protein
VAYSVTNHPCEGIALFKGQASNNQAARWCDSRRLGLPSCLRYECLQFSWIT